MKQLRNYINIRKSKSTIKATNNTIHQIVFDEITKFGTTLDLNHIDTSEVTKMYNWGTSGWNGSPFYNRVINKDEIISREINVDVSKWNVSKCEDFGWMFYECYNFNCDLSEWDVSMSKTFSQMFSFCKKFNSDLSSWNTSHVSKMTGMFNQCLSFEFETITNWDVSNVTEVAWMFANNKDTLEKQDVDLSKLWFSSIHSPNHDAFTNTILEQDKRPFVGRKTSHTYERLNQKHIRRLQ